MINYSPQSVVNLVLLKVVLKTDVCGKISVDNVPYSHLKFSSSHAICARNFILNVVVYFCTVSSIE